MGILYDRDIANLRGVGDIAAKLTSSDFLRLIWMDGWPALSLDGKAEWSLHIHERGFEAPSQHVNSIYQYGMTRETINQLSNDERVTDWLMPRLSTASFGGGTFGQPQSIVNPFIAGFRLTDDEYDQTSLHLQFTNRSGDSFTRRVMVLGMWEDYVRQAAPHWIYRSGLRGDVVEKSIREDRYPVMMHVEHMELPDSHPDRNQALIIQSNSIEIMQFAMCGPASYDLVTASARRRYQYAS